jgi:hypothetical protein
MHPAFEDIDEMKELYVKKLMEKQKKEAEEETEKIKI